LAITIDVDVGGTFTDGFITHEGQIIMVKVDTTPHDLTECFIACLEAGAERIGVPLTKMLSQTSGIRFSTTYSTNMVIERRGPHLGLLVTESNEQSLYNLDGNSPAFASILGQEMVRGVSVHISDSGQIIGEVEPVLVRNAVTELLDLGARGLVVSIKGAHLNPEPEQQIRQVVRTSYPRHYLGAIPILIASDISKSRDDEVRTHSALFSSYCHQGLARHLYKAEEELRRRGYIKPLLVVHSNGGTARVAKTVALYTYNSGPTAGSFGSSETARETGLDSLLTMDIGGTSTDISVIRNGSVVVQEMVAVDGLSVDSPALELKTLGGGGGSIARVVDGTVTVGPESAGALPGPMCYGLGGDKPTVADANLLLGYLNPDNFLGGRRSLDREIASAGIKEQISDPLGISVIQAAQRIRETVDALISDQLRSYALSKGIEVSQAVLFAFGGAGPVHASTIADLLEIPEVYCFAASPVFSAYGSSLMDVSHFYQRSVLLDLGDASDLMDLEGMVEEMKREAQRDMLGEGFNPNDVSYLLEAGVSLKKDSRKRVFVDAKVGDDGVQGIVVGELACRELAERGLEVAISDLVWDTVRLRATAQVFHPTLPRPEYSETQSGIRKASGKREVLVDGGLKAVPVYSATELSPGDILVGPAVIEAEYTTVIITHNRRAVIGTGHNMVLEWQSAEKRRTGR